MKKIKLAVIGGGSVNWMKDLMRDVYLIDEATGGEIHLIDPKVEQAQAVADMLHTFNKQRNKDYKITVSANNRKKALDGADFVMTTFTPGSMDSYWNDLELPVKYGIQHPVSMTVGIPGISSALRTVPVAYEIVEEMEKLCPDAWLLNVTNPMSMVTMAMNMAAKKIRVVGMCHELMCCIRELLGHSLNLRAPEGMNPLDYQYTWLPKQGFDYTVAGINHFIWMTKAELNGVDMLPKIRTFCAENDTFVPDDEIGDLSNLSPFLNRGEVKVLMCRQFGYLPFVGDRHLVEFYPSLCNTSNGYGMKHGVLKTTIDHRRSRILDNLAYVRRLANESETISWKKSGEEMTEIMRAIITDGETPCIVNLPNQGQIENMPKGAIVETFATVGKNGATPKMSGALPGAIGSLCRLHSDIQSMTVRAALDGDRKLLIEAMSLDPSTGPMDFADIPKLADELLKANKQWLPRF